MLLPEILSFKIEGGNHKRDFLLWLFLANLYFLVFFNSCESYNYEVVTPDDTLSVSVIPIQEYPWKTIQVNSAFGGSYFLMNDVNNDSEIELLSCRHVDINDVHSISSVACQRLDGTLIWSFGEANSGTTYICSEQPFLLYDWDSDNQIELLIISGGRFLSLNAANGIVERNLPLPSVTASDCITVCNISGNIRSSDILLKDRYHNIWAYDYDWNMKWHVNDPGGYLTCHRPLAVDTDGDGKDEVFVGFELVNNEGKKLWGFEPADSGHADSYSIIKDGHGIPADYRFGITYCFGKGMGVYSGDGDEKYSKYGEHYESIYSARFAPNLKDNQIFVEVDHIIPGPMYFLDENGDKKYSIEVQLNRFERPVKWMNTDLSQIVCPGSRKIYDYRFEELVDLVMPEEAGTGFTVQTGDMNNDKQQDIAIASFTGEELSPISWFINIYLNRKGPKICNFLGCSYNFSFYNDYDDSLNPLN